MAVQMAKASNGAAGGRGRAVRTKLPTPDALSWILADFSKILDEGEINCAVFIEAIEKGGNQGPLQPEGEKPDVTGTPIPRFDLLELDCYASMSGGSSRGVVPSNASFWRHRIVLYGRKPRQPKPRATGGPNFNISYDLGWRRFHLPGRRQLHRNNATPSCCCLRSRNGRLSTVYPFSFAHRGFSPNLAPQTRS